MSLMISAESILLIKKRFAQLLSDESWERIAKIKMEDGYMPEEDSILLFKFVYYIKGSLETLHHLIDD